jgi:hypothetical protein
MNFQSRFEAEGKPFMSFSLIESLPESLAESLSGRLWRRLSRPHEITLLCDRFLALVYECPLLIAQ